MKHATIYQKVKIKTWPSRHQQEAQNLTSAPACKVTKEEKEKILHHVHQDNLYRNAQEISMH